MGLSSTFSPFRLALALLLVVVPFASAVKVIQADSLENCQENSGFQASLFQIDFFPDNGTLTFNVNGFSTISGRVVANIELTAYGYVAYKNTIDPCTLDKSLAAGLCPLSSGQFQLNSNVQNLQNVADKIPGIAYEIPDLDGVVTVKVYKYANGAIGDQVACVQASLSNGKTVYQKGVGWTTAVVAGLALFVSAIVSGLGHSNTAAHIAANAMSLFGYFQSQAVFGMTTVDLPPIVASWTQNFQWSMGIIHVGFIQDICTWYQQATGGTPSQVLSSLSTTSVNVQKRSLEIATTVLDRASAYLGSGLIKRTNADNNISETNKVITVRGIERVGFRADIELTNIFMTGYIFFIVFLAFVVLSVVIFRYILEALTKAGKLKPDKFQEFRNGWTTVLRGILFRLVLIGFPQMIILCFWELTVRDSAGEIALAVVTIATMLVMLAWACSKVWRLARRSIVMHKNPAYILYSDPVCLHKWGFLYVQFKAAAYWFIIPFLGFILLVGLFIAFAQDSGTTQAIGLLILDAAFLVGISILRPYMDKRTNAFNISIAAVNFVSAIFLLFFTNIFGNLGLAVGVMGVIFFILNAAFSLILLLLVLVATGYAIFSKNPDVRYQPMRDDRGSFIKSQSQLTTELDALGATARGETKSPFKPRELDSDSFSGSSWDGHTSNNGYNVVGQNYSNTASNRSTAYGGYGAPIGAEPKKATSIVSQRSATSPTPNRSHTASPWQRGAGYD